SLRGAVDHVEFETILEQRWEIAGHDRRTNDAMAPRDGAALGIETGREPVVVVRAVQVVLEVFFSAPDHLDRAVHMSRDLDCEDRTVHVEPSPEPAAEIVVWNGDGT